MALDGPGPRRDAQGISPYYLDESAVPGSATGGGGAIPERGDSYIPETGTPTDALPTVDRRGVAHGGGPMRALWSRFCRRMAWLMRSGRG